MIRSTVAPSRIEIVTGKAEKVQMVDMVEVAVNEHHSDTTITGLRISSQLEPPTGLGTVRILRNQPI